MAFLLFFTAVLLSGIAAYYSVIGLIAIFSAAALPVAIMGGSLEAAKLVVASWLYRYWDVIPRLMKVYFTSALMILMLITSMGIFGFLSKAHNDQNLVSGEVLSKLAIYDEKIKTSKDNIEANRKALKQLDEAVDQVMARSTTETGADKAVQIRRQQTTERNRLLREIAAEQKIITKFNEEAAPIRAEVRKVEAEVGPIKYIAALLYGDNPETNLLERAVRWLIILLIIVFDPLAVLMLIAANLTLIKNARPQEQSILSSLSFIKANKPEEPAKEEPKQDDPNQYKIIPDQAVMPMAAETTQESNPQPTYTETITTVTKPATTVEKVGVKKTAKKVPAKKIVKKQPIKKDKPAEVKKQPSKKKTKVVVQPEKLPEPAKEEIKPEPQPQELTVTDKSIEQGFIPQPLSVEDQVQSMINSNDQQGLEQVYKQIVKELTKKNRTKSTHWGPIKNTKNG
jgi:hypothetical protein